nr:hypothetical protein [Staphylococcus equorum]
MNITGIGNIQITRQTINEIVKIAFGMSILGLFNNDSSLVSVGLTSSKSICVLEVMYFFARLPNMYATAKAKTIPANHCRNNRYENFLSGNL